MGLMIPRILIVDDEKLVRWGLRKALEQAGFQAVEAATGAEALEVCADEVPDMVLLDYKLPDKDGLEVLRGLRKLAPRLPVVMITAHASIGGAVEAMKGGVYDYISKPFEVEEVIGSVTRALEAGRLREEVARQREEGLKDYRFQHMVAESPAMREVLHLVRRVARSEASTILITGESGVGKGLVARALHFEGAHVERPFMHITCTALPETLLESELFGHEKGAFTDAKIQKKGLFELADGGTVFLDEIGDLSMSLQGKLLRFLEDKIFRRVGGNRDIQVSVRIIAATNRSLDQEVAEQRFRRDLYFRLRVIPLEIAPLRERVEDIEPLVGRFIQHFNTEFAKAVQGVEPDALQLMQRYGWPGNVRELRNAIERAILLADEDWLSALDLPAEIRAGGNGPSSSQPAVGHFELPQGGVVLDEVEKDLLRQALERTNGNRTRAARLLGINRDRIRYRIRKFELDQTGAGAD